MKIANIIDQNVDLNSDLLNKRDLWISLFKMNDNEEIFSVKPIKINVGIIFDRSRDGSMEVSIIGDKGKDQFNIRFSYVKGNGNNSFIVQSEGFFSIYEVEFFKNKKDAEKYYKGEIKKYIKHYGNLINKIKEYE